MKDDLYSRIVALAQRHSKTPDKALDHVAGLVSRNVTHTTPSQRALIHTEKENIYSENFSDRAGKLTHILVQDLRSNKQAGFFIGNNVLQIEQQDHLETSTGFQLRMNIPQ